MPREASVATSVLQHSATLHHPLSSSLAPARDADPHAISNKGSQGPDDGSVNGGNNTAGRSGGVRPRRGARREYPGGSSSGQLRGKQPPPVQAPQQSHASRPPLGTDGPVTLMRRSNIPDERAPLHNPQVAAIAHPPSRQQSLPIPPPSSSSTATLPAPGRSSEEFPAGYSRSGGIIQLPPEARSVAPETQPAPAHQRAGKAPTANRSQQTYHEKHHHRSNDTRPDAGSSRGPYTRNGGSNPASSNRRQRNHVRDSPEVFDRGAPDRSADGHQSQQQLFDPRRHNALSFSRGIANSTGTASVSDARTSSVAGSTAPTSAPSVASSEGRERRKRRGGTQSEVSSSSRPKDAASASGGDGRSATAKSKTSGASGYVNQLAKVYRDIQALESQLKEEHQAASDKEAAGPSRQALGAAAGNGRAADGGIDHAFWLNLTQEHKNLADLHNSFLELALRPGLPSSHHSLPQEYNLPIRLWHVAFHLLLERLRHSLPYPCGMPADGHVVESEKQVQNAIMDHLTDFIYYAYGFYSSLLESDDFRRFKAVWLENLGDLARYRMAVAGLNASFGITSGGVRNKAARSSQHNSRATSPNSHPRIDDDDDSASQTGVKQVEAASIGSAALGDWEFEDRETWSTTAKGWYAKGLAVMPGTGRLHHHLALLSRPDPLRALHHFCKALTTLQPFAAARESILSLFGPEDQRRRLDTDATLADLFVHLHGMLFTRVQLDDFEAVSTRFLDKLRSVIEDAGWEAGIGSAVLMMMGTINIASLMQYGSDSVILQGLSVAAPAVNSDDAEATEESSASKSRQGSPTCEQQASSDLPISLHNSIKLTFATLELLLPREIAGSSTDAATTPNPYVTIVMTLLFRLARAAASNPSTQGIPPQLQVLDAAIPWHSLASLPHLRRGLQRVRNAQKISALRPLPEDWCLRGLSWTGRRLFERDFFRTAEECEEAPNATPVSPSPSLPPLESEVDVLNVTEEMELSCGGGNENNINDLRWERIALALNSLVDVVPGFEVSPSSGSAHLDAIEVKEPLSTRLAEQSTAEKAAAMEQQAAGLSLADGDRDDASAPDPDDAGHLTDDEGEGLEDLEDDSEELRELKTRIRELRAALNQKPGNAPMQKAKRGGGKGTGTPRLVAVPGYTTLVLDTNVILTGNATYLRKLVESHYWTVIVPLAVITELDGLSRNPPPLGQDATSALSYLETSLKAHSTWLKVQTSKGNYLTDLSFRHEDLNLDTIRVDDAALAQDEDQPGKSAKARTLDEVIFRCFLWQRDHWTDRRNLVLGRSAAAPPTSFITLDTPKVVMVTLDRGLRLRVRTKGCPAAGKQELADILTATSSAFKT